MTNEQARRQYFRWFIPTMAVFLGLCVFIAFAAKPAGLPYPVLVALSVMAGAALAFNVWIEWRYIEAIDEFLRSIRIKAVMFAVAVVISVSAVWGLLELTMDVVALPVYYVTVIFAVAYSAAASVLTMRSGGAI